MKKIVSCCLLTLLLLLMMPMVKADSPEILYNPGFEEQLTGWAGNGGGKLEPEENQVHDGKYACKITGRSSVSDAPQQDITPFVEFYGQGEYRFTAWVRTTDDFDASLIMGVVQIVSTDKTSTGNDGRAWFSTNFVTINNQDYTEITGVVNLAWAADLEYAQFYLYTNADGPNPLADLMVDDCSIIKLGSVPADDPPEHVVMQTPIDFISIWWIPVLAFVILGCITGMLPLKRWYKQLQGKKAKAEIEAAERNQKEE